MNNIYYVYLHVKETTGEPFYVGKGNNFRAYTKNRTNYWKSIYKKYGRDVILLEDNLTETEAFELEKYWITRIGRKDINTGPLINFTDGGDGCSGMKHSEETKERLRQLNLGKKHTDETKEKVSIAMKGRIMTDLHKQRIGIPRKNIPRKESTKQKISKTLKEYFKDNKRILSEETKRKISKSNKGKKMSLESRIKISKRKTKHYNVLQFDKNNNLIKSWKSQHSAAKQLNIKSSKSILKVCRGKQKTCGGFIWKFKK